MSVQAQKCALTVVITFYSQDSRIMRRIISIHVFINFQKQNMEKYFNQKLFIFKFMKKLFETFSIKRHGRPHKIKKLVLISITYLPLPFICFHLVNGLY